MSCAERHEAGALAERLAPDAGACHKRISALAPHTWPGTGQGETGVWLRRLGSETGLGDWARRLGSETGPGDWARRLELARGHRPAEGTSWGTAMRKFLALGLAAGMFLAWLPRAGAQEGDAPEARVSEPRVSAPSVSEPSVSELRVSEPPVSEPPVSEPRVSEPRVSEPCVPGADALGVARTIEID